MPVLDVVKKQEPYIIVRAKAAFGTGYHVYEMVREVGPVVSYKRVAPDLGLQGEPTWYGTKAEAQIWIDEHKG